MSMSICKILAASTLLFLLTPRASPSPTQEPDWEVEVGNWFGKHYHRVVNILVPNDLPKTGFVLRWAASVRLTYSDAEGDQVNLVRLTKEYEGKITGSLILTEGGSLGSQLESLLRRDIDLTPEKAAREIPLAVIEKTAAECPSLVRLADDFETMTVSLKELVASAVFPPLIHIHGSTYEVVVGGFLNEIRVKLEGGPPGRERDEQLDPLVAWINELRATLENCR